MNNNDPECRTMIAAGKDYLRANKSELPSGSICAKSGFYHAAR